MSSISAGTTSGSALVSSGDTTGQLVLQTNGTTTAVTIGTNQVVTLAQPLPVASGGTGLTAPGTNGNILVSNGTAWTSAAPAGGVPVGSLQYLSSGADPGSGWLACNGTVYNTSSYASLSAAIGDIPNRFSTTQNQTIFNSSGYQVYAFKVVTNNTAYYATGSYDFCGSTLSWVSTSTTGATWSSGSVTFAGFGTYDLQYLNTLFFAINTTDVDPVGTNQLRTSPDFNSWTTRTTGAPGSLRTVRYLNSIYVTAGDSGFLATSTDAATWTSRTTGIASSIYGVAYGNGVYCYVGADGACATSTDLVTWTARTTNTGSSLNNLIFANGKFYAIGSSVTCISTDGITWTAYPTLVNAPVNNVIYGYGNNFYLVSSNITYWSNDAINWGVYVAQGRTITAKTSEILVGSSSSGINAVGSTYNPFTYTVATQFVVPTQPAKSTNRTGVTADGNFNLYIKAT